MQESSTDIYSERARVQEKTSRTYNGVFFGELIGRDCIKLYRVGDKLFLLLQDDIPYIHSKSGLFKAVQQFFHVKPAVSTDPKTCPELESFIKTFGTIYGKYEALEYPPRRVIGGAGSTSSANSKRPHKTALPCFKSFIKGLCEDVPRSKIIYSFF